MKESLKKIISKKYIHKIIPAVLRLFRTHTIIKLVLFAVFVCLLFGGIKRLSLLQIKYTAPLKINQEELSDSLGKIGQEEGDILAAETDTKKLFINTETLNLKVEDKASGTVWNSIRQDGTEEEKSLIKITCLGEDNSVLNWDSYTYAVKNSSFQIDRIEGGVRILLDMKAADSYRINEYLPQKITIEKYETAFIKGLEEKADEGAITQEEAKKYQSTLSLLYARDEENDCYYNKYSDSPPMSAVKQLIQMTKILNYTTEQLMEDNGDFGITVDIVEPADFVIPVEAVLEGEDFVVRVPTNRIENRNTYYTLTHMDVFPLFGAAGSPEASDGYILVPDGAGALLELNQFNPNYGTYTRSLYNNTYYNDFYYMNSYPETLHMPVFGMTYGKGKASGGGFMGIIESGDETAFITAALASVDKDGGGGKYNKVYSGFDAAQYSQVSILGPYDDTGGRFISGTGMMDINYKVRYKLYPGAVTYYDMAVTYRDYLINKYGLTLHYDTKAKLYLDVTGSLTLEERILGIPYDRIKSMTTYKELEDIMSDLKGIPLVVNYLGVFNGGLKHKVMNRAVPTGANGPAGELKELISAAEDNGQEIYFQTDFSKIYKEGGGFEGKTHGVYGYYGEPAKIYGYNYATGVLTGLTPSYYILNPVYLDSVTDGFLKEGEAYENLYIGDLASDYYASYKKDGIVTPAQAQNLVNKNLKKLAGSKTLSLNDPEMNEITYGKYAVNISRESSGYGGFSEEIPFRQLVMNGLIAYTTVDVNESGINTDYFLLQALELGSYPKFTVTAKNLDVLKNSDYTDFISRQYSRISSDIKELYKKYEAEFQKINSVKITNHEILDKNVFETTYDSGARVITNYNQYPVEINGQEIGACGYVIIR